LILSRLAPLLARSQVDHLDPPEPAPLRLGQRIGRRLEEAAVGDAGGLIAARLDGCPLAPKAERRRRNTPRSTGRGEPDDRVGVGS
jgi:hypothetical protein